MIAPVLATLFLVPLPAAAAPPRGGPPTTEPLFTSGTPPAKASKRTPAGRGDRALSADGFGKLAESVGPSVVFIRAVHRSESGAPQPQSVGTGFIIRKDGYILTNHHVIEGADDLRVRLHDDRYLAAEIIGTDSRSDIALLKVDAGKPLPVARLGDSDGLKVGEWVIAIGNPWNFDHTVTAGIVSAVGRSEIKPATNAGMFANFIQTDAAINQGNSGGPLINLRGEVIGINSAIFRPSKEGGAEGINFAIPINMAKELLPVLHRLGRVPRSWLGVESQAVTPWLAQAFHLGDRGGALIAGVKTPSPASKAGLRAGDVVLELAGRSIAHHPQLEWLVSITPPGTPVPLRIVRDGKPLAVNVTLVESPDGAATPPQPRGRPRRAPSTIGIAVTEITAELAKQRSIPAARGVVVMEVDDGSPALEAGVQRDDVVLRMGTTEIKNIDDYVRALKLIKPGSVILLHLSRGPERIWAAFPRR